MHLLGLRDDTFLALAFDSDGKQLALALISLLYGTFEVSYPSENIAIYLSWTRQYIQCNSKNEHHHS